MAKGLRASNKKANKSRLRSKVFGPVEDARTERLSAKLLELASQPKPPRMEMEIEGSSKQDGKTEAEAIPEAEAMDIDSGTKPKTSPSSSKPRKSGRIHKKRRGKATSSITFPTYRKGRRSGLANAKR